jgi:hypothetical protein
MPVFIVTLNGTFGEQWSCRCETGDTFSAVKQAIEVYDTPEFYVRMDIHNIQVHRMKTRKRNHGS